MFALCLISFVFISLNRNFALTLHAKTEGLSMSKLSAILILLLLVITAGASPSGNAHKVKYPGGRTYMFRVELRDKCGTPFSISRPKEFLSAKAIVRRSRQHIDVDSTDLPVNPAW